jgi:hypothetical protein
MDPWLEDPGAWPDVHASLLVTFRRLLGPLVRPRYYVRVEVRLYEAEIAMADAAGVADVGVQRRGEGTGADERRLSGAGGVATAPAEAGAVTAVVEVEIPLSVYDQGSYDLALDYRREPVPPLEPADAAWADALLHNTGLR